MKVFNDSLNADSKNEARVMARQDELDKQWDEIVSLKQKLQDTRAKSNVTAFHVTWIIFLILYIVMFYYSYPIWKA